MADEWHARSLLSDRSCTTKTLQLQKAIQQPLQPKGGEYE